MALDFATTSAALTVDVDGDGSTDIVATSSPVGEKTVDRARLIQSLRKLVGSLSGRDSIQGKNFLKRIDKLEDSFKKNRNKKIVKLADKIENKIGHIRFKDMKEVDKRKMINMMDDFLKHNE